MFSVAHLATHRENSAGIAFAIAPVTMKLLTRTSYGLALVVVSTALSACNGSIKWSGLLPTASTSTTPDPGLAPLPPNLEPTGAPGAPNACEGVTVAASAAGSLRRLSTDQQLNSYRDIFANATMTADLPEQQGNIITEIEVEELGNATAVMTTSGNHLSYLKCNATGAFNDTCADAFIASFGRMTFRRALLAEEQQWLKNDVYLAMKNNTQITPAATFRETIDTVAQVILQSGQFLYMNESGATDASLPAQVYRLTGAERASRLSYLLWNSTPDETLLSAADSGALDTAAGVETQARRLLASPRAHASIRTFATDWLELNGNSHLASLEAAPKNATRFPFDSPTLRKSMREEIVSLYEKTFFDTGSLSDLLTSKKAYVNTELASVYGISAASTSGYSWVDVNPAERSGFFTRAAFLTQYAPQDYQSPIRRGVFLYKRAFCQPLADPPPNVNNTPAAPSGTAAAPVTVRQQVEVRTAACMSCHGNINPLGFTLENFDAMGRWQTKETGTLSGQPFEAPIDSTATLVSTDLAGKTLHGPLELATEMAGSGMVEDCMARTWFVRAKQRDLLTSDACSVQRVKQKFRQSKDMRELLLSIVVDEGNLFIQRAP